MASSRAREVARASSRFATLTYATTSTSATAPSTSTSHRPAAPTTKSCSGVTTGHESFQNTCVGYSATMAAVARDT